MSRPWNAERIALVRAYLRELMLPAVARYDLAQAVEEIERLGRDSDAAAALARAEAAEVRATALERELGVCQAAARALVDAYVREERAPANAVEYAMSLPPPPPRGPEAS